MFFELNDIIQLFADLGTFKHLKEGTDSNKTSRAYASLERNAPKLLGYIPSWNTTLFACKKSRVARAKRIADTAVIPEPSRPLRGQIHEPIDLVTSDPFFEGSTDMSRVPFILGNLEDDDSNPEDASLVGASGSKKTKLVIPSRKHPRPEGGAEARRTGLKPRPIGPIQISLPHQLLHPTKHLPKIWSGPRDVLPRSPGPTRA